MDQKKIWDAIAGQWHQFRQGKFMPTYDFLKRYEIKQGKVLEVGCGNGRNLLPFAYLNMECHGLDFSKNMLAQAKELAKKYNVKFNLKKGEIVDLPYKTNQFHYLLCVASLHHLDSEEKILQTLEEAYRVLKDDGLMLLTVWNKLQLKYLLKPKDILVPWKLKGKKYDRYYHLFDFLELKKLIKKTKFRKVESNIFGRNLVFVLKKEIR